MKNKKEIKYTSPYEFEGRIPWKQAIPMGLQHVLAMFVGNLTPILIITGACGIAAGSELADLQVALLQNAMLIAGIVTLVQLFAIGPVGGKVPVIMGTSSGFIGVFSSVANAMGGFDHSIAAFKNGGSYGDLFKKELIQQHLPNFVTDEEEKQMVENFSKFTTLASFPMTSTIISTTTTSTSTAWRQAGATILSWRLPTDTSCWKRGL